MSFSIKTLNPKNLELKLAMRMRQHHAEMQDHTATPNQLKEALEKFCQERGFQKGNAGSPDHLSAAIITESNELFSNFKTLSDRRQRRMLRNPYTGVEANKELADVLWFSLLLSARHGVDLSKAIALTGSDPMHFYAYSLNDETSTIGQLKEYVKSNFDRPTQKLTPREIAIELMGESCALFEQFRFRSTDQMIESFKDPNKRPEIDRRLGRIFGLTVLFAANNGIDLSWVLLKKLAENEERYPADKLKGGSYKKYNEIL